MTLLENRILITEYNNHYSQTALDIYKSIGDVCYIKDLNPNKEFVDTIVTGLSIQLNDIFLSSFPRLKFIVSNTTGLKNTAVGTNALQSNQTGNYNTAIGTAALHNNTGSSNTAIGRSALQTNTSGTRNIAIGYQAYDGADTEVDNLAIGYDALGGAIAGGEYNVAIGNYSLDANTTGDYNVAIVSQN